MVEKISVQIALEGAAQIERELADIGKAGQQCFADIQRVAEQAGGFAKLDPAILAQKFKQFGISASADINKISKAVESATKLEATTLGIAELERGFGRAAAGAAKATAAFGLTRREIGALGRALRATNLGAAGSQLALIGRVGGAFGPVGIAITTIAVAIAGAGAALVKFATDASATEKALSQLQKVSGVSFQNLSALQQVFAAGGTPLKKFTEEFGNLSEQIAAAGQQAAIRRADKDVVQWANDVGMVRKKFDELNLVFSPLTTLDTKVQAVLESLAKAGTAEEQWRKLADIFKNLGSDMERAQLGKALGLSPESIATLSQGSAKMQELQAEAQRLGLTLTTSNQQALQQMAAGWNQFTSLLSALFQKIGALAAPAFASILNNFKPVMAAIVADFENMPIDQAIANLGTRLGPAFTALGSSLIPIVTATATALGTAFADSVLSGIQSGLTPQTSLWDAIFNDFLKFGESIVANAAILGQKIRRGLASARANAPEGGGGEGFTGGGFAGGGLLGGRGTGTSDSNLAWVSRGEHIMPARAVAQPGVLALLEALRRSGGNLAGVLDGMGRFALGGMVPRVMPAFANGGLAGGMSNVTIQFPGLPAIGGLRASSEVVDQLHKAAALAQVRSGGRKPSRYS